MMIGTRFVRGLFGAALLFGGVAAAAPACPDPVAAAAAKAVPDATLAKCTAQRAGYVVKMQRKDRSIVELDITAKGEIEQIEEVVPVAALPEAVTKAFAARYPTATITKAEKMTAADKRVSYELAFKSERGRREATFTEAGAFVEE